MNVDGEGHILITPAEIQQRAALVTRHRLINDVLIPGTPFVFPKYDSYCDFLEFFSARLGIHPRSIGFCGSGKIGFSIAPRVNKVWGAMRPDSDIDLAIMDPAYFEFIDERIRDWEHRNERLVHRGAAYTQYTSRLNSRRFYFLRYEDLPECLPCVSEFKAHITGRESAACREACCGRIRPMKAFIYRDWRSFYGKYQNDLHELCIGIDDGTLPKADSSPRII